MPSFRIRERVNSNSSAMDGVKCVPPNCARIAAKIEGANPTGSMKDRMAKAVIERAEADGRIRSGDTVVEYTSGTTGISLALVCGLNHQNLIWSYNFAENVSKYEIPQSHMLCSALTKTATTMTASHDVN